MNLRKNIRLELVGVEAQTEGLGKEAQLQRFVAIYSITEPQEKVLNLTATALSFETPLLQTL